MSREVSDHQVETSIIVGEVIIVLAANLFGRDTDSAQPDAGDLGKSGRQQAELDILGDLEFALLFPGGNQVGGGSGKKIATVAGAAAGGYAGNKVQGNMPDKDTYTTTERRCNTVTDSHENVVGYSVTYMLGDNDGKVRMDTEPGSRIPLDENGQLVLD